MEQMAVHTEGEIIIPYTKVLILVILRPTESFNIYDIQEKNVKIQPRPWDKKDLLNTIKSLEHKGDL